MVATDNIDQIERLLQTMNLRFIVSAAGDRQLDTLKLGFLAWDGDVASMVEAELLLGHPEQLLEERVVEVDHWDQVPAWLPVILPHVHCKVTLRHRGHRLCRRAPT